jgi:serine/threonine protein phosphatase PrpC
MRIISYTNKGLRSENEDYLMSGQLSEDISFHIIADGMGGYSYGADAAMIVSETILTNIRQSILLTSKEEVIIEACEKANRKLLEKRKKRSSKMGATFAATLIVGDSVYAFWMGDSRIYQFDENYQLQFQSEDHSLINELRLSRKLTANEIRKYDSIVTRSLTGESIEKPPQIEVLKLSSHDTILLCSDGFYKQICPNSIINLNSDELVSYLISKQEEMTDNYSMIKIY